MNLWSIFAKSTLALGLSSTLAYAQDGIDGLERIGKPVPGGLNFQPAATELARDIQWLDSMILIIITVITLFVTGLLIAVVVKFNKSKNPVPATFTHHSALEIGWTLVPILILIFIGSFSLPILFKQLEIPEADMTIKVTGFQWAWTYEYPDMEVEFDAYMLEQDELEEFGYMQDEWKLATDAAMIVPINKIVRMQIASSDVIHAWKVPAFGVHVDAMPGRLNETWFKAEIEGVYFGQCSELCGLKHSYMPIVIKVVSEEVFASWVEDQGGTLGDYDTTPGESSLVAAN